MGYYAILSDIHGSLYALESVVEDMNEYPVMGIIMLGDIIDYGMRSNEVIEYIRTHLQDRVICNIRGNHERAILEKDFRGFSSKRGEDCARYTAGQLTDASVQYLTTKLINSGSCEFEIDGINILAVHGSLDDEYWGTIEPGKETDDYSKYDLVLSGHSHKSHMYAKYYEADFPEYRNKHKVMFINPGSVGQPRNHDPNAQYALIDTDTGSVFMRSVPYNVDAAMATYDGSVDDFYRKRLLLGV
ncbi:MAG: metallophosphoesterase family protein [Lachnospiraceae bacterium]|nr:metallophosphoesterase family protein [Lachnospiraceae bacterium]